jgi:hypothetical protein
VVHYKIFEVQPLEEARQVLYLMLKIDPGVHFRPSGIQFQREKRYKSDPSCRIGRFCCADVGAVVSPFGRFGKATQLRKELEPGLHEATIPFCV